MLPGTKVKSLLPAGIRGTFMKREGEARRLSSQKMGSLSLSLFLSFSFLCLSSFHQPLFTITIATVPSFSFHRLPRSTYFAKT